MSRYASLLFLPALCAGVIAQTPDTRLMLQAGAFDPLEGGPAVPETFAAAPTAELQLVQFKGNPTAADRAALLGLGIEVKWYAPHDGYVVRGPADRRGMVAALPTVRWVGPFHTAYKFEPALLAGLVAGKVADDRYVIVMADPHADEASLVAAIERAGGSIWRYAGGNLLIEADLSDAQLRAVAPEDTVLWIQRQTPISDDMANARIQGGANYIEAMGGHTGKGVRGHIMEGIYPNHPEYAANAYRTIPVTVFSGVSTTHGNSTFGEIFAGGIQVRGMMPDGQGYFTDYNYVYSSPALSSAQNTRYGVVQAITDPAGSYKCMFQTASWGYAQITAYDARSAEMDWIIHQFDIPICQSQSNTSNQNSRPQAWAKNIISVGALNHLNTANPNDDTQSGTSMGPAADGRIKPDMCGYYDQINTTNGATSYTTNFGGTSGATPMVAGHLGLIIEMFTDGYFGHPAAPSWNDRFPYKPHFSTAKALLINTARQYDPAINGSGASSRYRQGWGFPALQDLYDLRSQMLVADEQDVLAQNQSVEYLVYVKPGTPQMRATMVYADLAAAAPFSSPHRVNNLDILVTAPNGTQYNGNTGMTGGAPSPSLYTTPGGSPNNLDTVENVFVQNPASGMWRVRVSAPLVALDQHLETGTTDADFALVVSGIGGGRDTSATVLDLASSGPGNLSSTLSNLPAGFAEGYVFYSVSTTGSLGNGTFFGFHSDALSVLSLGGPAAAGDPLHFTAGGGGQFPNAAFTWPPFVATLFSGFTLEAIAVFVNASGQVVATSNVDRVTVQ